MRSNSHEPLVVGGAVCHGLGAECCISASEGNISRDIIVSKVYGVCLLSVHAKLPTPRSKRSCYVDFVTALLPSHSCRNSLSGSLDCVRLQLVLKLFVIEGSTAHM